MSGEIISSDRQPPVITHSHTQEQGRRYIDLLLKMVDSGVMSSAILKKSYAFIDRIMQADINPHLTCKRGCSHCCTIPVAVCAPEAHLIAQHTRRNLDLSEEEPLTAEQNADAPCVFLKNNECSIYEVRPYVCRTFGSFEDPKYCAEGSSDHYLTRLEVPFKEGHGTLINWIAFTVMANLGSRDQQLQIKDIRQFFRQ